jgi:hypothetical protein
VKGVVKSLGLAALWCALGLGACGGGGHLTAPVPNPTPLTFALQNGGSTSVYLFEDCVLDLTITEMVNPPQMVGLPGGGCGVCDCGASSCPPVACGACYDGGLEVAAGATQAYVWTPVDVQYETGATATCSRTQLLPAGQYRIDVPVYASADEAAAKTGARVATATFSLPGADNISVALAGNP